MSYQIPASVQDLLAAIGRAPLRTAQLVAALGPRPARTTYDALRWARERGIVAKDDSGAWQVLSDQYCAYLRMQIRSDVAEGRIEFDELKSQLNGRSSKPMVKFYREVVQGRTEVCIETDAADERAFLDEVAGSLPAVIAEAEGSGEVRDWLRRVVDVACKMRGYKADVIERRVIQAGTLPPADTSLIADSRLGANGADPARIEEPHD